MLGGGYKQGGPSQGWYGMGVHPNARPDAQPPLPQPRLMPSLAASLQNKLFTPLLSFLTVTDSCWF